MKPLTCKSNDDADTAIIFSVEGKVLLSLNKSGIVFHKNNFEDWIPGDFAKAFMHILSSHFNVEFSKKHESTPEIVEKKDFYLHGKYFDTFEEMMDFGGKWPDMPLDLDAFRRFLDQRYDEAKLNFELREGKFTNRAAYYFLYVNCEWASKVDI